MPLYDYRCTSCGTTFEVNRQIGQSVEECCPDCGASAKRVFTPVGVHFKGTGFHNTDYKSRPAEQPATCPASTEGPSACDNCPSKN